MHWGLGINNNTVETVLNSHHWGMAEWPLNKGWLLNAGSTEYPLQIPHAMLWACMNTKYQGWSLE